MDKAQGNDECVAAQPERADDAAAEEPPKEMYTDEYIRLWEPLDPLDPDRMTDEHHRAIIEKMYRKNIAVYERLAQL